MPTALDSSTPAATSYYALRLERGTATDAWLTAARRRRDAPRAVVALLAGRTRVEVEREAASEALTWAGSVDGWADADPKPLTVHPHDPRT